MKHGPDISAVAALIGDPARCNMLGALLSGEARTAGELAAEAGISLQTASFHIGRLDDGGLVTVTRRGRHRYVVLAGPEVARALESLTLVAEFAGHRRTRPGPKDPALRRARVCYDHLAGELGVRLFESLVDRGALVLAGEELKLGPEAGATFASIGIAPHQLERGRAAALRPCMDWSERRWHLGGAAGRLILGRILELGWASRIERSRALAVSRAGELRFDEWLGGTAAA